MKYSLSLIFASIALANQSIASDQAAPAELDTVNVTADFRQTDIMEIPSSITVVGSTDIDNRNANHLEDVLALAPNINFAGSSSRARYFQIRGIGERSQFIDPFNPSVGLFIDGVDMTGLGGAATLFDVKQVEILRGPQGTAFGANALAGAINIESNKPTKETEGYVEAKAGNYHSKGLGAAISGSLSENAQGRISLNKYESNGYITNAFLDRDDTNNIDEALLRAQLAWQINPDNDLNLTFFKADINNGYDAFNFDNNRTTISDEPGEDSEDTNALSLKHQNRSSEFFVLDTQISASTTDSTYAYDADWVYPSYDSVNGYTFYDEYIRESDRAHIDLRAISSTTARLFQNSTDWVLGATANSKTDTLNNNGDYKSEIDNTSSAFYAELTSLVSDTSTMTYGIRIEQDQYDFESNNGINESGTETLWGGKISYETLISGNSLAYATLSRGFKPGSVNQNPNITENLRTYEAEINNTVELGTKSSLLKDQAKVALSIFYTQRKDQQVKQSFSYIDDGEPEYTDYYANVAEGKNYGLEAQINWNITKDVSVDSALGLLETELVDYTYEGVDKSGREQAHAPSYTALIAGTYNITRNLSVRLETEAKDSFYYSSSHDKQSKSYQLWNATMQYSVNELDISLVARNMTNEDYTVKGYFIKNDPKTGYEKRLYTQKGNPALISLNVKYNF